MDDNAYNFGSLREDFLGAAVPAATASEGTRWFWKKTAAAGSPTVSIVTPGTTGELSFAMGATSEAEANGLNWNDKLCLAISKLRYVDFELKLSTATLNAVTSFVAGVGGAHSDTYTSITTFCGFYIAANNSNLLTCRATSAAKTTSTDSTYALGTTKVQLRLDFSNLKDVKFFVAGSRLLTNTNFDWSGATGSIQPVVQIGKASGTNTDGFTLDLIDIGYKRN